MINRESREINPAGASAQVIVRDVRGHKRPTPGPERSADRCQGQLSSSSASQLAVRGRELQNSTDNVRRIVHRKRETWTTEKSPLRH